MPLCSDHWLQEQHKVKGATNDWDVHPEAKKLEEATSTASGLRLPAWLLSLQHRKSKQISAYVKDIENTLNIWESNL
jgi:hypothetical protein